jgi:hypothetical protein
MRVVSRHHIEAKPAATGAKAYLSGENACRYLNLQASYAAMKSATTHLTRIPSIDSVGPFASPASLRLGTAFEITPGNPRTLATRRERL